MWSRDNIRILWYSCSVARLFPKFRDSYALELICGVLFVVFCFVVVVFWGGLFVCFGLGFFLFYYLFYTIDYTLELFQFTRNHCTFAHLCMTLNKVSLYNRNSLPHVLTNRLDLWWDNSVGTAQSLCV